MLITVIYRWIHDQSGKSYIGITSNPHKRRISHLSKPGGGAQRFSRALKKYGIDNFTYEELSATEDRMLARFLERFFIRTYDSKQNGYNLSNGGEDPPSNKHLFGENAPSAKINEEIAKQIIMDRRAIHDASLKYGISEPTIHNIRTGVTWKHLDRSSAPEYNSRKKRITKHEALAIINDPRPHCVMARKYGIGSTAIQGIRTGRTWKTLDRSTAPIYINGKGRKEYYPRRD